MHIFKLWFFIIQLTFIINNKKFKFKIKIYYFILKYISTFFNKKTLKKSIVFINNILKNIKNNFLHL